LASASGGTPEANATPQKPAVSSSNTNAKTPSAGPVPPTPSPSLPLPPLPPSPDPSMSMMERLFLQLMQQQATQQDQMRQAIAAL
jgi:hypothetical protein